MTAVGSYILSSASVEVTYLRGVVYLDRCGSLMLKLQDQVGAPFEPNLPDMKFGELQNAPEHLVIQFGPKSFAVLQSWVRSPARVEQLAPPAWDLVADELGVRGEVTRCGARLVFQWRVSSVEEGESLIAASKLFVESPAWIGLFGEPKKRSWSVTSTAGRVFTRATVSVTEHIIQGGRLPADLEQVIPPCSLTLDIDRSFTGDGEPKTTQVSRAQLKDFIRESWRAGRDAATKIEKLLGIN